jgi:hypothetical protein
MPQGAHQFSLEPTEHTYSSGTHKMPQGTDISLWSLHNTQTLTGLIKCHRGTSVLFGDYTHTDSLKCHRGPDISPWSLQNTHTLQGLIKCHRGHISSPWSLHNTHTLQGLIKCHRGHIGSPWSLQNTQTPQGLFKMPQGYCFLVNNGKYSIKCHK